MYKLFLIKYLTQIDFPYKECPTCNNVNGEPQTIERAIKLTDECYFAFGYVNSKLSIEDLAKENLFIEVEKKKYSASIILKPLNSKNIRVI